MKLIPLIIGCVLFGAIAIAGGLDFNEINKSVYKIQVLKKTGVPNAELYSGTGFFINDSKLGNVLVTNDHICASMYKGLPIIVVSDDGELKTGEDFEGIGWVYLAPGMDICIAKLLKQDQTFPALKLSTKKPKIYDPITVTGYDGEKQMLISEGYIYGETKERYYDHVEKISPTTQRPGSAEYYMADEFGSIPIFKEITQLKGTTRVSPGYSGSPVLNVKGEVIGIVNGYDIPTEVDNKSYAYFFTADHIREALKSAELGPYNHAYFLKRERYLLEWHSINSDVDLETYKEKRTW